MAVKLSSALSQLLGKLGLAPDALKGEKSQGLDKGEGKKGEKGDVLGDNGELLIGLGFNPEDRKQARTNVKERANVQEFVQARGEAKTDPRTDKEDPAKPGEEKRTEDGQAKPGEVAERGNREDVRRTGREERAEEARAQELKEQAKDEGPRREAEAKEQPLVERVKDREEEAHGPGWAYEQHEEEQEEGSGYRNPEVLSDHQRCNGVLDDGTRCLHRSIDGQPFCRAHMGLGSSTP